MTERLSIGIIGCGQVSRVGHGPAIKKDRRAVIRAVADPDDKGRLSFQKKFRVENAYTDHREMLKKERLDAVVIASPPWLHREHLEDALDRGVHVLCEKPLATTPDDCRKMAQKAERAESAGTIVQIGHSKRFETGFQKIREMMEADALGRIYQMSVYWHYYIPDFRAGRLKKWLDFLKDWGIDLEKKYGTWRYFDPRAGGGDLFDHAPHYIDLMRFFFGEIESVMCRTRRFIESRAHEDLAAAIFTLENNAVAVLEKSTLVMGRPVGFEVGHIYGERAKISFEAFQEYTHHPMHLEVYRPRNIILDRYRNIPLPQGKGNTLYFRQMTHFIDRITGGDSLMREFSGPWAANIHDAREAVLWTLAAYRSQDEGRAITRDEVLGM
ncbi:MAG: Gfo/Idh/MocA family oxidoreductase [Deltaproteobacteria bacterium]|nr:Gfo/Idh/MocA family oxidoreductase [Candidatus Zymogenaceae bacterium]